MRFWEAIKKCLRDWITFSGRAPRSEYWWFTLALVLLSAIAVALLIGYIAIATFDVFSATRTPVFWIPIAILAIPTIYLWIASISATVRRLHDINRSGWWLLAYMVVTNMPDAADELGLVSETTYLILGALMIIALIALLIAMILPGTQGANRFGPDPKAPHDADIFE